MKDAQRIVQTFLLFAAVSDVEQLPRPQHKTFIGDAFR
jgi:hypothetical protein